MVSTTPRALGVPMSVAICLIILFVSVLRGSAAEESSLQESNFTGVGLGLSVFAYVDTMDAPDQSSAPLASPALAPEGSPTPSPQSAPPTPSPGLLYLNLSNFSVFAWFVSDALM